ncbi:MAG: hypothetical protein NZ473_07095, partial [Candidatus Kapabacteria bacterium]|nr:hypothetical protein [Candidatus Kapabacteria bacterium]
MVCVAAGSLQAQVPPPLELPEVVIIGQEERQIPGGMKQQPLPPSVLPKAVLDTLNPLSKHTLVGLLPLPPFPATIPLPGLTTGSVTGSLGQYSAVALLGHHRWTWRPATLALTAYIAATQGHVRNADSIGAGVAAQARFSLPKSSWIFQDAHATAHFSTRWGSYNLFGEPDSPRRTHFALAAQTGLLGRLESLEYNLGIGVNVFSLRQGIQGHNEQHLQASLYTLYPVSQLPAGGVETQLNMRFWGEKTQVFWHLSFPTVWARPPLRLHGAIGLQVARSYDATSFFLPAFRGELQYGLAPGWRMILGGRSFLSDAGVRE